jgi:hypothetical protein
MRTIILNGRKFRLSASEERALRILKRNNFAAKKSEFVEGSTPRYQNTIVPKNRARQTDLGIYVKTFSETLAYYALTSTSQASGQYQRGSVREKMFFKNNPRCQSGIFGNPRRINAILNKIDAQINDQIMREHEYDKECDPGIVLRERGGRF